MKFFDNEKYTNELNEIITEYNNVHYEYGEIIKQIDKLNEQLKDLDLLRQESEVKLLVNRDREKKFMENLEANDFEAYIDLKKNLKDFIAKKIEGQND